MPLDEDAFNRYGTSILPRFCSKTDLPLRRVETADGTTTTEWIAESVGRPSAVDMSFGEIFRDVAMEKMADNQLGMSGTALFTTAARTSVHDFLVHRPTFGRIAHHVTRWGPALDFPQLPPAHTGLPQLPARIPFLHWKRRGGGACRRNARICQYASICMRPRRVVLGRNGCLSHPHGISADAQSVVD